MGDKRCPRCGYTRPIDAFYIKDKVAGRRHSWCKPCYVEVGRARYLAKKALRPPAPPKETPTAKVCTRCQRMLDIFEFNIKSRGADRRRSHCVDCKRVLAAEYRIRNADRIKAANAAYRESRREELLERHRLWREAHPESLRAIAARSKAAHKDSVNASTHRRRARLKGNGGSWTAAEWKELKARYGHRCLMCGQQEPVIRLTVDHVIPAAIGGPNTIDNIQPLCKSCNSKKHLSVLDLRQQSA